MSIHEIGSDLVRALGPKDAREPDSSKRRRDAGEPQPAARSDSVEISAAGRELAAGAARMDEIHDRIDIGYYDLPAQAEELARRLIASGDLAEA